MISWPFTNPSVLTLSATPYTSIDPSIQLTVSVVCDS